jgi:APA family basic amino acid/polyamine antiporter
MSTEPSAAPERSLTVWHAAALAMGMVIGAGIFRSSSNVAAAVPDVATFFLVWSAGGLFALMGALCYAELAGAFPSTGGDYGFLRAAYGRSVAFLFAWSRFAIVFTGSTALLGFVLSDYVAKLIPVGPVGQVGIAAGAIVGLTGLNLIGVRVGATVQVVLVVLDAIALMLLGLAGVLAGGHAPLAYSTAAAPGGGIAVAAVFIMLAYGGWNDAATLSTELRGGPRAMVKALVGGMSAVTILYLVANWGYWRGLGLAGLAASKAPAADLMGHAFGPTGETLIVALVALTTLACMNALIIVGGRTLYATAGDFAQLAAFGRWDVRRGTPRAAMLAQSAFAILLVGYGAWTRTGFETMVNFLAPVFWLFQTLSGVSLLVLRQTRKDAPRPFRLPLYPVPAIAFSASSAYVFVSTVAYVGWRGVLVSFSVLGVGALALIAMPARARPATRS